MECAAIPGWVQVIKRMRTEAAFNAFNILLLKRGSHMIAATNVTNLSVLKRGSHMTAALMHSKFCSKKQGQGKFRHRYCVTRTTTGGKAKNSPSTDFAAGSRIKQAAKFKEIPHDLLTMC